MFPAFLKRSFMTRRRILGIALLLTMVAIGITVYAQVNRPFHNGSVWTVSFIHMKPGMETTYLNYIASDWKREQEALKSEGIALSYKVLTTEGHNPGDFNIMLMTEYKDLATLEANDKKADALAQRVVGTDEKQAQGYKERADIREVLGTRLAREIVLTPNK
jgi:hypothetical protein